MAIGMKAIKPKGRTDRAVLIKANKHDANNNINLID